MKLSIVIPTFNEAETIGPLVTYLMDNNSGLVAEIIVADGGSTDDTLQRAKEAGAVAVLSPNKGRGAQMNYGASLATGVVLYFVHADCKPPKTFTADIAAAVSAGFGLGRYRTRFDSKKLILKINALATRFDLFVCMGGDQTLFITQPLFKTCHGFKEDMRIMEEYDLCVRARAKARYKIMNGAALVSARKYETNSWLTVQLANAEVVRLFKKGASQERLVETYQRLLNYRKSAG